MRDRLESKLRVTRQMTQGSSLGPIDDPSGVLLLIFHGAKAELFTLREGERLVVGRGRDVDLTIEDDRLSRRHVCFEVLEGEIWVEDLRSTNGTKIDDAPITRALLPPGSEVSMGSVRASIHLRPVAPTEERDGGHEALQRAVEEEAKRARTFARDFAVVTMRSAGDQGAERLADLIYPLLRVADHVACYSAKVLEVLLVEADEGYARDFAERARGVCERLRVGLALYSAVGAEEILRASLDALRAGKEGQIVVAAEAEPAEGAERKEDVAGPVIQSPSMERIYQTIPRLASSAIPVLLVGETGSGKEVIARALHEYGPRRARSMASINCGAIPSTLVESVLFGHVEGAFTGAHADRPGLFEQADGGTLFLDEIGELSASAQVALLRVLESKRVKRVGALEEIEVDVRVIAATLRDLEAMCQRGEFRQDLLYRINTMVIEIPPLRDRPEEIAPLAERFLEQANRANDSTITTIARGAMRALMAHVWPGNVRELRNVIERAVVIAQGSEIVAGDLPLSLQTTSSVSASRDVVDEAGMDAVAAEQIATSGPQDFKEAMEQAERQILVEALQRAGDSRKEAAAALGMPLRTFSHKLRQYGIKKRYS